MMRTKLLLFSVLLYSTTLSCSAQSADKSLDKNLSKIYKESNFPGFAIAIIKDDSILFSKGYGFADIKLKVPYTIETIQPVASVSKTFVALALMKCVELAISI
jgi:CubicO group peptidase (beta-lactamase class C family)